MIFLFFLFCRGVFRIDWVVGLKYVCLANLYLRILSHSLLQIYSSSLIHPKLDALPPRQLNLGKAELLFSPGKSCPLQDLFITTDNTKVTPTLSIKPPGVTLDSPLSYEAHDAATTLS